MTVKPPAQGSVAGGSVQFEVDGVLVGGGPVALVNGQAISPAVSTMGPGTHSVTATYLASGSLAPSTATLQQVVSP